MSRQSARLRRKGERLFQQLAHLLAHPGLLRTLGTGIQRNFARALMMLRDDLLFTPATIVDAGASTGAWSRAAMFVYPEAMVYAFEPVPESYARLVGLGRHRQRFACFPYALGSTDGQALFHENVFRDASSLLPMAEALPQVYSHAAEAQAITVDRRRLDSVVEMGAGVPVLLKLDVQGAELEVLAGCGSLLPLIDVILLEVNFALLYEGQAEYDELCSFLHRHGFTRFLQLEPGTALRGGLVSCDLFFFRDGVIPPGGMGGHP